MIIWVQGNSTLNSSILFLSILYIVDGISIFDLLSLEGPRQPRTQGFSLAQDSRTPAEEKKPGVCWSRDSNA